VVNPRTNPAHLDGCSFGFPHCWVPQGLDPELRLAIVKGYELLKIKMKK
jgi:hypothetical protein